MKQKILCILFAAFLLGNEAAQTQTVQGLRIPRLTVAERDRIMVSGNPFAKGVTVYNLDSDCHEYWNGEKWISLCQGSSSPEVEIPQSACHKIRVYGKYYKNAPLNSTHYITLPITVSKTGNYSIIASSNNGYYFQASGVFESVGAFELKLDGMGTPNINRQDELALTCNSKAIGELCDIKVTVYALSMGYQIDCDNIEVVGAYQTRNYPGSDNVVKVPIEVLEPGSTTVSTDLVNGMRFTATQTLDSYGADTLILRAEGSPKQAGAYNYSFTTGGYIKNTCSFTINCTSTLGTFSDPACKCLAIYEENPLAANGEYWLQDCEVSPPTIVKTYCDIANGGWTLVWSFSERTARNTYVPTGRMEVSGNTYSAFQNAERNIVRTESVNIDYNNYRLSRLEWQHFPINTSRPQIKVRIATNATDMNDEWGKNNYAIISPRNKNENPIEQSFDGEWRARIPAKGKIYGKNWEVVANGGGGNGGIFDGKNHPDMGLFNHNNYCTHWNFANNNLTGGTTFSWQVVPNPDGLTGNANSISINNINDAFGWWGGTEQNHHFGKCGNSSSDYSFSTKTCAPENLHPHSFNGGEGRYCQWFVK